MYKVLRILIFIVITGEKSMKSFNKTSNTFNVTNEEDKIDKNKDSEILFLIIYSITIISLLIIFYLQTNKISDIQKFLILLFSGLANVLTGILLFEVKGREEFVKINGLLILVQPLMGLKGNLEMTMASRMSTLMNLREVSISWKDICIEIIDDIILVQSQATVLSFFASIFAIIGTAMESTDEDFLNKSIILCAISLLTANTACFFLGFRIIY